MADPSAAAATGPPAGQEAAIKARIIGHMNKDHSAELEHYLRAFNGVPAGAARGAQMTDLTLDALAIHTADGRSHTVTLSPPMPNLGASRTRLVEMAGTALARLGLSDIRVTTYRAPAGADLLVLFGVGLYFVCAATRCLVVPGRAAYALLDAYWPAGGAEGYRTLVKAMFVPVVAIHLVEAWWMQRTRLAKHRVPVGSRVWCLWILGALSEGAPAFRRLDRVVDEEHRRKEEEKVKMKAMQQQQGQHKH
jgi:hypothetical protein